MRLYIFLLIFIAGFHQAKAVNSFDKVAYYTVLKSGTITEINNQIALINASSLTGKDAFIGALLMKKADLLKVPKQKLDAFKSGRIKFETAFRADTANIEYRFLRLIIQEHAPKIVKYNKEIGEDAAVIKKNYKQLSADVKKILIDYSQTSKALKPQDFES